jgi:peptide deformylase
MPVLKILEYPDPRLRTRAVQIASVDDDIRRLVADMFETMYTAPGVGLAATQVDVHKRVIVMDVSETKDEPKCLINPEILEKTGVLSSDEGCLSVPGVTDEVERAEIIRVRALDRDGESMEIEASGLLAVCIKHELVHLEG